MTNKKAQGIGINTMIIAAIAILVLVVIAFLIFRTSRNANDSTDCVMKGGTCVESGECDDRYEIRDKSSSEPVKCDKGRGVCCSPFPLRGEDSATETSS